MRSSPLRRQPGEQVDEEILENVVQEVENPLPNLIPEAHGIPPFL
jgi:hypothetical protein